MNSTETIADIVAWLAEYKTAGERPSKEDTWRLGKRIESAAARAVLAETERCAGIAQRMQVYAPGDVSDSIADVIRGVKEEP